MQRNLSHNDEEILESQICVSKVNILSVMKFSFLVSVGLGIAFVVMVCLSWFVLDSMHVFSSFQEFAGDIGTGRVTGFVQYLYFSRVLAISIMLAILGTVVLTAISVLYAYIYNVVAHLVGGIKITITNE
ncbi:DUF3566 domain-containing protein [Actinomyces sp. zg-332]|uniref:DUF3566 domain-containing protein n=1 Tax=Actinomyces sp. zg-332 TaxID=2708340 RepID=UPI00141E23B7|nr:DUF3566 domain-containing protein [Actinomyces sp. zg-332]QPK94152.1 DUF3566 domain-containing protein [Actinomyces sp. zg-332]